MTNMIGEFLVQIGLMFPFQVEDVVRLQAAGDTRKFGEIAMSLGYIADEQPIRQFLEYQGKNRQPGESNDSRPDV